MATSAVCNPLPQEDCNKMDCQDNEEELKFNEDCGMDLCDEEEVREIDKKYD